MVLISLGCSTKYTIDPNVESIDQQEEQIEQLEREIPEIYLTPCLDPVELTSDDVGEILRVMNINETQNSKCAKIHNALIKLLKER